MNGDLAIPHNFVSDQKYLSSRPYPPSHVHQQQPAAGQQHLYAVPARAPNPPGTNWYGGSQPSLDSQPYLSSMNITEAGSNILPGLHRPTEIPGSRGPLVSTSQFHPSSRLASQRARLRRSNTIGSSEIGQHLPAAMAKTAVVPYHGHTVSSTHLPDGSHEAIRYLLGQTTTQYTYDSGPPQQLGIGSGSGGALAMGHSPTERVLRRLAQMANNAPSFDRSGPAPGSGTQPLQPFDLSRNTRIQAALLSGQNVDSDVSDAVKGR